MVVATEADYVLGEDDALYVDYGCVYQYYCSATTLSDPNITRVRSSCFISRKCE